MRSMTGYGRAEAASRVARVTAEITSVNRKQADIVVNLPRSLASLETMVRREALTRVSRGRVTLHFTVELLSENRVHLQVDDHLATEYHQAIQILARIWNRDMHLLPGDLLRAPGVFSLVETELPAQTVEPLLHEALLLAFQRLQEMQEAEGTSLRCDLEARLTHLQSLQRRIAELAPNVKTHYREQLQRRLLEAEVNLPLDDERIIREVALYAERCDISEELTRLESHFNQCRRYFASAEPAGRSLDFLCQELNRELNTIGSKANHASIAQCVVEAKTELEKVREQVQNVQ